MQTIPSHKIDTIFDMFAQADHSLEKYQGGLGIGLTLMRCLVETHGGSVTAQREGADMGSTLEVRLPIAAEASAPATETAISAPARNLGLRVLIVDDNRDSADSLAMVLQLLGHDTSTAYDGFEGIAMAQAFAPQAILMDIGLPKLNGYEACRRIRALPETQRPVIVAITGWGQEADRQRSQEAGFDHHMVKPIDISPLVEILGAIEGT